MLPHLAERPVTRKRWPERSGANPFFEKNAPAGTPSWVRTQQVEARVRRVGDHELLDLPGRRRAGHADLAGQPGRPRAARAAVDGGPRGGIRAPDRLVVDLDPGPGAGLAECAEVAHAVRDLLETDGLTAHPVTSGSKGMQLYAAVSGKQDAGILRAYAKSVAEQLARQMPHLVVSRMTKTLRPGKVLARLEPEHRGEDDDRAVLNARPRDSLRCRSAHLGPSWSGRRNCVSCASRRCSSEQLTVRNTKTRWPRSSPRAGGSRRRDPRESPRTQRYLALR